MPVHWLRGLHITVAAERLRGWLLGAESGTGMAITGTPQESKVRVTERSGDMTA